MNVVLIYNPLSGGRYELQTLRREFRRHQIKIDYTFTIKQLSSRKLASLISDGVTVAAVGGDGTLNAVASKLIGSPSKLLPLPGGTFNHFVRDLGMSARYEDVLANISAAKTQKIDVGFVNEQLFLNNSNLGLYPFSLIERKTTKKFVGKWVAALLSAVDQLAVFRRHRLIIDGKQIRSPFVFIGNNIYDISASLIPQRTKLSEGALTMMVATSASRLALIRAIFDVMKGDVSHRDDFTFTTIKEVAIYSPRLQLPVSYDGEVAKMETPLRYKVATGALSVLVVPNTAS